MTSGLMGLWALAPADAWGQAPALVPAVPPPTDQVRQQVLKLVHEAGQLVDRGDRAGAVVRLQQAQALWPDPSLDYNLGMTYAELGQHPAAAQALERFLHAADRGAVLGERLDDARRRLDGYQRTLARLKVAAQVPVDAQVPAVFVDGERPDRPGDKDTGVPLPMSVPLWVLPGPHSVRVAASGARDYQVQIELRPGELRQLSAELLPLSALSTLVPASAELRHASDPASIYKKWWFWTAVGSGAATVLTVGVGLIAAGASGKLSHTAAGSDLDPVDVAR